MSQTALNRKQRRATKNPQNDAATFFNRAKLAIKQKHYALAIDNFIGAIQADPKNHHYKIQLCGLLKNISFNTFNPEIKKIILKLLMTKNIDHQSLWQPWFSLLMTDPAMSELQELINGGDLNAKKLRTCLNDPYLLTALNQLLCFDINFERTIQKIYTDMNGGTLYPKSFRKALDAYCSHNEYLTGAMPKDSNLYEIDKSIATLSTTNNKTSQAVSSQYEENPYPRWISYNTQTAIPDKAHNHLIAGCGTGYAACMTAMLYPNAKITAIDLSLASLSYAKKKATELGLKNITFYRADILDLDALDQKFDVIECSGVLHHMHDPLEGWQNLIKKLKPDGKMHIGLYSELGRQDIVAARKFITGQKYEATPEGIKTARQKIADLPDNHPAHPVTKRRDFYSMSSCRDLLFHVQEHRFTIPQLDQSLKNLNLVFDRFNIEIPDVSHKYLHAFPDDPQMQNLENWAIFEDKNPASFGGMYQFWCHCA